MMQDAWRDNWQPSNVFLSSRPATSFLGVSLAINPLENRWPIKSCVQGEPPLINADCQGASLMYFSFKESVSNAHCFGEVFFFFLKLGWCEQNWRCRSRGRLWEIVTRGSFLILAFLWMKIFTHAKVTEIRRKWGLSVCLDTFNVKKVLYGLYLHLRQTDIKSNPIRLHFTCTL